MDGGLNEERARYVHDNWDATAEDLVGFYSDPTRDLMERSMAVWLLNIRHVTGDAHQVEIIETAIAEGDDTYDTFTDLLFGMLKEWNTQDTWDNRDNFR